ncbi:MAG: PAS domain S-box protein [Bryobacteraceae bacterium]|nr:PAS domain S-box protein [Bryobacteraceae bacterium]
MLVVGETIAACNPACEVLFGAAAGGLNGKPFADLAPERQPGGMPTRAAMDPVLKRAAEKGLARTELQCRRWDGSHFWCEVTVKPTTVAGEQADLVTLWDVSVQKRTEDALRKDEARFRCFAEIIQHPAGTLKEFLGFALDRAVDLTGSRVGFLFFYDPASKTFTLNTHSSEAERECKVPVSGPVKHLDKTGIWGEAVRQRRPIIVNDFQAPNPLKRGYPEGHVHLERFMAVPVFRNSEIAAVVGLGNKLEDYGPSDIEQLQLLMEMVWNVVNRLKAEEALRRKSQELEDFFQSSLDLLCIADFEGHFVRLNPQWENVLGYRREELEGRLFFDLVHPEDIPATQAAMEHLKRQKPLLNFENRYRCKDGSYRWIEWRSQPRGNWIYAAARDITERKRMERELREANRQLEQAIERANRLAEEAAAASAAKSDFLAHMSHEIRTPLNGVLGMLQLLMVTGLDEEQQRFAQAAASSAESLLALLEDILDLSRIEAGKLRLEPEDFEIRKLLESVTIAMTHGADQKGLGLHLEVDPQMPRVLRGDPKRLRQVLTNLIGNAIKFTPAGRVRISARLQSESEAEVVVRCSVKDTGIGIPEEKIGLLFQKFTQLDSSTTRNQGGAGLGLAIAKQLCELMGGEIGVTSNVGEGSEFWFTARLGKVLETARSGESAPMRSTAESQNPGVAEGRPTLSGERIRVLVVEDNRVNREVALEMLRRLGVAADAAENGMEALYRLRERHYDLVLMDVQMPRMDGYEASMRIRTPGSGVQNPNVPIIALTAHALTSDRERCLAAGMNDYLSKPLRFSVLAETVRRWAGRSHTLPANADGERRRQASGALRRKALLARFGHDSELVSTTIEAFLSDTPCQLRALREALERQDRAEAERVAHTIKGSASYVGGEELSAVAGRIEQALHSGGCMKPEEWLAELESQYAFLLAELSSERREDAGGAETASEANSAEETAHPRAD